jgi:hypothetical protein
LNGRDYACSRGDRGRFVGEMARHHVAGGDLLERRFEACAGVGPLSTITPKYMTVTRSHIRRMIPKSCEMNTYVRSNCLCTCLKKRRIVACTETSKPAVGSSKMMRRGFSTRVRAKASRR